jgi:hypothetical protein
VCECNASADNSIYFNILVTGGTLDNGILPFIGQDTGITALTPIGTNVVTVHGFCLTRLSVGSVVALQANNVSAVPVTVAFSIFPFFQINYLTLTD